MTRLPGRKSGYSAATLGGWNIGVSKYSNNPHIAAKVVEFLTGEKTQKERALNFGLLPTINKLYYGTIIIFNKLIELSQSFILI